MKRRIFLDALWYLANFIAAVSLGGSLIGWAWEWSAHKYLQGFSDAVVPAQVTPEQKVEAILAWMRNGPNRLQDAPDCEIDNRNPEETLNYSRLLAVCGTATNAFTNLAHAGGVKARRLLLLDSEHLTKHVVAEVQLAGRWVVVDPAYRIILRDASGRPLTRVDLRNPALFREAIGRIDGYNPNFTYESAVHIRLARIPVGGLFLQSILDRFSPDWDDNGSLSMILERVPLILMSVSALFCLSSATFGLYLRTRRRLRQEIPAKRISGIRCSNPRTVKDELE